MVQQKNLDEIAESLKDKELFLESKKRAEEFIDNAIILDDNGIDEAHCSYQPWNRKRFRKHRLFMRQYRKKKDKENYWKNFLKALK